MALYKEIRQDDGVITTYHRILYIDATINSHISIAVLSYVDNQAREEEQRPGDEITFSPYKRAVTYETDYRENMTVKQAYAYLKTLPEFEDAQDV